MNWIVGRWNRSFWLVGLGLAVSACLCGCDDDGPTGPASNDDDVVADYVIRIREVSPRAGAFVSAQAVIVADLEYAVPDSVWGVPSDELEFSIHVRFDSTEEGRTVAIGEESRVDLLDRSGRLTFIYPLGQIWNYRLLQHPVTARFSLVAWSESGEGIVVENTEEIQYRELRL